MRQLQAALLVSLTVVACNSSSHSTEGQDPKSALGGVVYRSDTEPSLALGAGPLFVTDVMIDGNAGELFTSPDASCKERIAETLFEWNVPKYKPSELQSHHGMKLFVAAGKTLCFHSSAGQTKLVWAGSRSEP